MLTQGKHGVKQEPVHIKLNSFQTAVTHVSVTLSIFGTLSAAAAALIYFLPETKDQEIPDTIGQTRRQRKISSSAAGPA